MAKNQRGRRSSPLYLPGAFDLFRPSKELVLKNIWVFGPLYAVSLVFYIHSWIWSPLPNQHVNWWQHGGAFSSAWSGGPIATYPTFLFIGFNLLWLVIVAVVGSLAQIMSQAAQLDAAEGRPLDFQDLWKVVKRSGWQLVGLYIVVGLLVGVGLVLLVVPGMILARRYFLAPYIMIEKRVSIKEALDLSAALTGQNPGSIWGIIGVMFLIGLLNLVPVLGGLAAFVIGSLYSVAPALRYQQLKRLA